MTTKFRLSSLIPAGLIVERSDESNGVIIVSARAAADRPSCPLCSRMSDRVHSRYVRIIADLPCAGTKVQLRLSARRFICEMTFCRRRIFVERFGELVVPERSRRTARFDTVVHHLGLALGGRPAAAFAKRLMIPVSNDTLIRAVRRKSVTQDDALNVVGVDDWAFRRNHRYGTLVCDLEKRRITKLLPDRETATVSTFLAQHPEIAIVSRDRGGGYREAAGKALPHAIQVADRWHYGERQRSIPRRRAQIHASNPGRNWCYDDQSCAERLQYDSYLRREDANSTIGKLSSDGVPIKEIVRQTGYSRGAVRQIVRGHRTDVFRVRQSSLEAYLPLLDQLWRSGQHNGAELWRQLKRKGFRGCSRVVGEWAARRRRSERVCDQQLQKVPSARTIARLMTTARDQLSKADTITVAAIEASVPALIQARNLIDRFQTMIRRKAKIELDQWIADARDSLFAPFANGILKDKAAVSAAITESWTNGQVEGQINKLKLVKRQMYGRAKLDLLQARLIGAI
ncbi:ISL3 family transposase [Rhizobium leguminosarum]|uniref:ISL3 family transposase n=1 Tax=Rhizobium leguminosarum TaxID=384 RepID=UPI0021BBD409|nr:ISL3 family transposase [Rhizobium leguminosarum]